jgi:ABC transport system ATP-binding/permease protein
MSPTLSIRVLPDGDELSFDGRRPVRLGRERDADVVVVNPHVSRDHAVLVLDPVEGWTFEDRSHGGTYVAGTRVTRLSIREPVLLRLGSAVDGAEVLVSAGAPAPPAAPAPAAPAPTAPAPTAPATPEPRTRPESASAPPAGSVSGESGARLGQFNAEHESDERLRLGRGEDNDIVIPDLLVSRHHAELRREPDGTYTITDLRSHNGTFVDGQRVAGSMRVGDGSVVSIGHHLFKLHGGRFTEYVDTGEIDFAALGLSVIVGGKPLLDEVSFTLGAGSFVAVLGPTGAGKSTLLKALTGARPADIGQVIYNGRDLYRSYAELRHRLGYVPQDDILHTQLTVRDALRFSARLRFPADVTAAEREQRVDEVMEELGLTERAHLPVGKLSGGQRKRTSVALELLTRPSLLLLDEPTSGLDPGYEKSVMDLLRNLADGGRTVITVTHSIQSLDRCDRILFLAPGGQTAYFGPPAEALGFFRRAQYAEVFLDLDHCAPGSAKEAFAGSPQQLEYVEEPIRDHPPHE